jgi:hypothetical protein
MGHGSRLMAHGQGGPAWTPGPGGAPGPLGRGFGSFFPVCLPVWVSDPSYLLYYSGKMDYFFVPMSPPRDVTRGGGGLGVVTHVTWQGF